MPIAVQSFDCSTVRTTQGGGILFLFSQVFEFSGPPSPAGSLAMWRYPNGEMDSSLYSHQPVPVL